jgi:hypothetical protein
MDFISILPRTSRRFDSILMIVGGFIKSACFIPVHTTYFVCGDLSHQVIPVHTTYFVCGDLSHKDCLPS